MEPLKKRKKLEPLKKRRKLEDREEQTKCSQQSYESSRWSVLPVVVLVSVLSLLDSPDDRWSARLVCRHWYMCMNDSRLWKNSHLYIRIGRLTIPEWSLLNTRQIMHLSFHLLPPCKLSPILNKLWPGTSA